jgi:threonine dehydrogenase-like Zn-dependent dehydrogenase
MQALVLERSGSIALHHLPVPEPSSGECLVRVRTAGICGTDLQLLQGYADFQGLPGHEFAGIVESVGSSADRSWVGKRVVGEINIGCGACEWCASGVREHCTNRTVLGIRGRNGAFAERLTLPAVNLHELPSQLDDRSAVFVEPVAACCRILEQVDIRPATHVAVLGDGRMGLLAAQVIRTVTPDVTLFGRHDRKLAIARELGLTCAPSRSEPDRKGRFDVVVDATGRPDGFQQALEYVRPRGIVVMKSTFHGEAAIASWPIVVNEVTIVGSRCGPFARAIDLLASGAVRTAPLVSRIAALADYDSAFEDARRSLKVLFTPA